MVDGQGGRGGWVVALVHQESAAVTQMTTAANKEHCDMMVATQGRLQREVRGASGEQNGHTIAYHCAGRYLFLASCCC